MARLLLVLAVVIAAINVAATSAGPSCASVKSEYNRKGFKDKVPRVAISGSHLKMCQGETTCCTEVMERKLSVHSREEFDNNLKNLLNPMASLLAKKNIKLIDVFGKLLNFSRKSFDDMFSRTYGILYQQNAYVFTSLYDNLEKYFKDGELDLTKTMDEFFKLLYQRMFTVYNAQYTFSPTYLKCVTQHMEELQPFGEVPKKLTTQIKRSFVALRTFVQGLATGRDVVKNVLKENLSRACVHKLMRMTNCPTCEGLLSVHPCMSYCQDVINICLAHHQPLIPHWVAYVDIMVNVGERLENPFNIENVVQPVNFKVSDAIMNFQEAGHEISQKVFKGCGSPRLGRSRRNAAVTGELSQDFLDFSNSHQDEEHSREAENLSVSRHIHEIKTKIKNSRDFWGELPTKMCKDAMPQDSSNCWTGTKLGKYESKPGSNVTETQFSSEMNVQIMRLKVITNKLREAYNGRDVSWIDEEPWLNNGGKQDEEAVSREEGSGSGSSYPYSMGHYPPDDEDAYPSSDSYAGSGAYESNDKSEGSGDHGSGGGWDRNEVYEEVSKGRGHKHGNAPTAYDPYVPPSRPRNPHKEEVPQGSPEQQPPSAATKESMSLYKAVTIYMLPAFIMFLGSLA